MLFLFGMEATLRGVFWVRDSLLVREERVKIKELEKIFDWVVQYEQERINSARFRWESYVYWRRLPYNGECINVGPGGLRTTWTSEKSVRENQKPIQIWMFGGSTMWGWGSRDDHTISSYVARKLTDHAWNVRVKNFGETGFVSTQESILFQRELLGGLPDIAVFYDGINDIAAAHQNRAVGLPMNEANRRVEFNMLLYPKRGLLALANQEFAVCRFSNALLRRVIGEEPLPRSRDDKDFAQSIADVYMNNTHNVCLIAADRKIDVLFFLQPLAFTRTTQISFEDRYAHNLDFCKELTGTVYKQIQGSTQMQDAAYFHDISDVLDDEPDLCFIDGCHTTEIANEVIAEHMVSRLLATLESRFPDRLSVEKSALSTLVEQTTH